MPQWHLIHCKQGEDERALENLERQGFQCFWPTRLVERRRQGRRCIVTEALFPRNLLIRLDSVHDNWMSVCSTRGVHQIVRFGTSPAYVGDEIINGIRARSTGPLAREPYLKPGERVCITEGAFSQLEAIFVENDGDDRVVLLLNFLHQDRELSFPMQGMRKLGYSYRS